MQRYTANLTQRAHALLPCDEDDDGKKKPLVFFLKYAWLRKANFRALLVGVTFVMLYLGGFLSANRDTKAVIATPPTTIQPLYCHDFLRQVNLGSYRVPMNVHDPNHKKEGYRVTVKDPNGRKHNLEKGQFIRETITEFPFWISLHHEKFDHRRWNIYKHGQYYQRALEEIWTDILKEASPGARVIDIG
jgi:hypothetical protein